MPAAYPGSLASFTDKLDLVSTIFANDVNSLQTELLSVQTALSGSPISGLTPQILNTSYDSTAHSLASTQTSVNERLKNIERGLLNGVTGAPYVRKDLSSVINVSSGVPLTLTKASGNNSNLLETTNGTTPGFKLTKDGIPFVDTHQVLYESASNTAYQNLVTATSAVAQSVANLVSPLLLAGM
ncbi:hypothetical protein UFOVP621_19 [uncultured Caudovirales phage]|uniref:Uncharacterized protein n=1 Tax=uncultured Caudovirales phage TaxID=2100421 RepID=A0A6J5N2P2_9CAUD|nr:hypothetical protein UFOVP621_19 [uncultured Caudovirales phage]